MNSEKGTKRKSDENTRARDALRETADEEANRILPPSNQIGRNKFLVYGDAQKKPLARRRTIRSFLTIQPSPRITCLRSIRARKTLGRRADQTHPVNRARLGGLYRE